MLQRTEDAHNRFLLLERLVEVTGARLANRKAAAASARKAYDLVHRARSATICSRAQAPRRPQLGDLRGGGEELHLAKLARLRPATSPGRRAAKQRRRRSTAKTKDGPESSVVPTGPRTKSVGPWSSSSGESTPKSSAEWTMRSLPTGVCSSATRVTRTPPGPRDHSAPEDRAGGTPLVARSAIDYAPSDEERSRSSASGPRWTTKCSSPESRLFCSTVECSSWLLRTRSLCALCRDCCSALVTRRAQPR